MGSESIVFQTSLKSGNAKIRVGKQVSNITEWNEGTVELGYLSPSLVQLDTSGTNIPVSGVFRRINCKVNGAEESRVEVLIGKDGDCTMFPNGECPICTTSGTKGCKIIISKSADTIKNQDINITVVRSPE